jgi:hypothetical protein
MLPSFPTLQNIKGALLVVFVTMEDKPNAIAVLDIALYWLDLINRHFRFMA